MTKWTKGEILSLLRSGAILSGANLTEADLTGADLTGADLTEADLTGANLSGTILTEADLTGADLTGADLTGADLRNTIISKQQLLSADLSSIQQDTVTYCKQFPPEDIRAVLDTLYRGEIDGQTYVGTCSCLAGTLQRLTGKVVPKNGDSPRELFIWAINMGDTPAYNSVAAIFADWLQELLQTEWVPTGIIIPFE